MPPAVKEPAAPPPVAALPPSKSAPVPAVESREKVRQRELEEAEARTRKVLSAVPEEADIPEKVVVKVPDHAEARKVWSSLQGTWVQSDEDRSPDIVEGGYSGRTLVFGKDGVLTFRQQYGPDHASNRTMDYAVAADGKVTLGAEKRPDPALMAKKPRRVGGRELSPAAMRLPVTWEPVVAGDRLTLGGKTYRRQP